MSEVHVVKDDENESRVPDVWRATLSSIVDALVIGGEPELPRVSFRTTDTWRHIKANVEEYGAHLIALPQESWNSSVCIWVGEFWDILVDLYAEEEGRSDLVLQVHIREAKDGYRYEVVLVYVP
jgi:hypothetical protein